MAEMEFTTAELVEAHAQVWNLSFGYLKSMCLKCSLELGIADRCVQGFEVSGRCWWWHWNYGKKYSSCFPEGLSALCLISLIGVDTLEDQQPGVAYVEVTCLHLSLMQMLFLLKWILTWWNNEECVKILQRCKEAIPPRADGGKVIIIDMEGSLWLELVAYDRYAHRKG
ncbi:uncharacterized protein LOC120273198 [Dioscorea cayenensis subsp. rotundata]|uniref:Uncharacterized protein LOC120273198 n=1 Tax=Dioscorea cayennensis subsp. rotundata TaxID=55577 RepID=A0AB40C7D9_DIOCR|nr:uncharacterized protein LOC120273198 [Dioscorea cayenensis subsp. rotundata]